MRNAQRATPRSANPYASSACTIAEYEVFVGMSLHQMPDATIHPCRLVRWCLYGHHFSLSGAGQYERTSLVGDLDPNAAANSHSQLSIVQHPTTRSGDHTGTNGQVGTDVSRRGASLDGHEAMWKPVGGLRTALKYTLFCITYTKTSSSSSCQAPYQMD